MAFQKQKEIWNTKYSCEVKSITNPYYKTSLWRGQFMSTLSNYIQIRVYRTAPLWQPMKRSRLDLTVMLKLHWTTQALHVNYVSLLNSPLPLKNLPNHETSQPFCAPYTLTTLICCTWVWFGLILRHFAAAAVVAYDRTVTAPLLLYVWDRVAAADVQPDQTLGTPFHAHKKRLQCWAWSPIIRRLTSWNAAKNSRETACVHLEYLQIPHSLIYRHSWIATPRILFWIRNTVETFKNVQSLKSL